jgi:hypothetical protein
MMKYEKFAQRCVHIGQEFFVFQGQKSSVPSGCVPTGIRVVKALGGMNDYHARALPSGLRRGNSNAIVAYSA